jgi:glycosyltransferase involved in cell wall biosynthesis
LAIAGDGPDRTKLQQMAHAQGIADRVIFLGQIPTPQVRALLETADLFVLNSGYEGMPHVVLEAMAARVPVIATDVGGTSEIVKHNQTGLLIPVGNERALLTAVRELLGNTETRTRLVSNARQMMEQHFVEEACFLAYESVLVRLIRLGKATAPKPEQHPVA